jgi:hypothetical protein
VNDTTRVVIAESTITSIPEWVLALINTEVLFLDMNEISELTRENVDLLAQMKHLRILKISRNRIIDLPVNFGSIKSLEETQGNTGGKYEDPCVTGEYRRVCGPGGAGTATHAAGRDPDHDRTMHEAESAGSCRNVRFSDPCRHRRVREPRGAESGGDARQNPACRTAGMPKPPARLPQAPAAIHRSTSGVENPVDLVHPAAVVIRGDVPAASSLSGRMKRAMTCEADACEGRASF